MYRSDDGDLGRLAVKVVRQPGTSPAQNLRDSGVEIFALNLR
jgi:hypothetical protein